MAYSQQTRHRPQRPHYGLQEPSYDSSYSRGHAQPAEDQGYGYNGGYGEDPNRHHPDPYGAEEGYGYDHGYDQQEWSDTPAQRQRNDGYYAGKGQQPYQNGRADQHRHPKSTDPAGHGSGFSDPRSCGAPPPKTRSPMNGHHGHQNHHHQPREHQQPQDHRSQYDRYQNVVPPQAKGGYGYGGAVDEPQDSWRAQSDYSLSYDPQVTASHSNGRHQDYQQPPAIYDGGYDQRGPQDSRQNAPHSKHVQPPKIATKIEEPKQKKQPPKRILDDLKSPDTVAWDNPFPTFPAAKSKPKVHSDGREHTLNGSAASKPYTVNDKSSHGFTQHDGARENGIGQSGGHDSHTEAPAGSRSHYSYGHESQERPSSSHTSRPMPRADDSQILGAHGRHSEDNRSRPTIANEVPRGSGYERSHTMPTAVTDAIINPHDEMPEVATWQEPGAAAGYYGGEDKGFVHSSPIGAPQHKLTAQPRAYSDESRQHQPTPRFPPLPVQQLAPILQPHAQQDSLGEVFDSYYDRTRPETKPYVKENPYQRRRASLDEMPNFSATHTSNASHGHEMTIDQHLQPQLTRTAQAHPALPLQDLYSDQRQPSANTRAADPFPRSRSQPDFNGQRSPSSRPEQDQSLDFSVSRSAERRPATSNSRLGPRGQYPARPPTDRLYQDPRAKGQQYSGPVPGTGQMPERPRGNGYHDPRHPDRHRSPLMPNGYADSRQQDEYLPAPQDRYRSLPPQNGPYGDPGQQDRHRSPPVQNAQPLDDRIRRTGGEPSGPSPNSRNGPTSPPNKPLPNPDALPHHPAPIRPGLIGASPVNSANKPPPVRQYNNNASPINLAGPAEAPGPGRSKDGKRGSDSVTYQELDKLRQKTQANPEDQVTRFLLAKKLVEASTVLINERADPKSRDKARDDYIAQALKMLKKLSSNQYPEAMFYVGDCYSRGALGLQADVKEAFTLYQSAAKANHAQAAYRVAVCCEMGQDEGGGTRKDPVKAMQWYKRAAQLGDVPAMYKMGIIQLKGLLGQPRNPKEALVFLKKAAERADTENPHALHELGLLHENGSDGVPKDERYSKDLFIRCANLGYKFSQYRLGCAYEYGLMGCPVDPRQSIAWYSKAAVQEEHQSELALSGWYLTGSDGVLQQSDTEAYLWARKAAQAGLAKAEYAMGYFTEVGIGAPANLEDAKRWYWRAACKSLLLKSSTLITLTGVCSAKLPESSRTLGGSPKRRRCQAKDSSITVAHEKAVRRRVHRNVRLIRCFSIDLVCNIGHALFWTDIGYEMGFFHKTQGFAWIRVHAQWKWKSPAQGVCATDSRYHFRLVPFLYMHYWSLSSTGCCSTTAFRPVHTEFSAHPAFRHGDAVVACISLWKRPNIHSSRYAGAILSNVPKFFLLSAFKLSTSKIFLRVTISVVDLLIE